VRREVATALVRDDIRVIPVRVGGAAMPSAAALPEPLRALTDRHAFEIRDDFWDYDVGRLIAVLEPLVMPPEGSALPEAPSEVPASPEQSAVVHVPESGPNGGTHPAPPRRLNRRSVVGAAGGLAAGSIAAGGIVAVWVWRHDDDDDDDNPNATPTDEARTFTPTPTAQPTRTPTNTTTTEQPTGTNVEPVVFSVDDELVAPPRGDAETALGFAVNQGAQLLEEVEAYLHELYRLAPQATLDPAILVAQSAYETDNWTSVHWTDSLNPAGIGVTGDPSDSPVLLESGEEAAQAHLVHAYVYAVGPIPARHALSPYIALDPNYDDVIRNQWDGTVTTIQDMSDKWSADPAYGQNVVAHGNEIFSGTVGSTGTDTGEGSGPTPTTEPNGCAPPDNIVENEWAASVNDADVNLRIGPGYDCAIVRILGQGEEVTALSDPYYADDGVAWTQVETSDGLQGWVVREFLSSSDVG
jgi:hypothetical protein